MSLSISSEKCIRCGICVDECPAAAICYGDGNSIMLISEDCNECGACLAVCVAGAIAQ